MPGGQFNPHAAGLDRFELARDGGETPDMTCTECGERLCSVDDGDTLAVLVAVALDHDCEVADGG